jgi:hypothetical protein
MIKLVMMLPQDGLQQQWARRLDQTLPQDPGPNSGHDDPSNSS